MTREEFKYIAIALSSYYPDRLLNDAYQIELWFKQLQDLEYSAVEQAVNKWVATQRYVPTIADIRSMCIQSINDDWGEGWREVVNAIQCFGAWNIQGAMESMSPITRKVVERLGFYELCNSENLTADRANFRQLYERIADRDRQEQLALGVTNVKLIGEKNT